ncbi:MAG: WS/DGAT/MGAT family O-acyltransferase [Actinomycetota bacterium]
MYERLSTFDASFLSLEKSNAHMHFAGLAIFDPETGGDGCLDFQAVSELFASRMHRVPRLRQRLAQVPFDVARPVWVDDPGFDLHFHLRRATLSPPGGPRELAELIQRIHSSPLDRSKPLWQTNLIDGLEGGHVAVLSRAHHAMVDGLAGMRLAGNFLDLTPQPTKVQPDEWHPDPPPSGLRLLQDALVDGVADPLRSAADAARSLVVSSADVLQGAQRFVAGTASLALKGIAPNGPFNADVTSTRRFAMANVDVSDGEDIRRSFGGTMNDVVLAVVAESLHRQFESRGRIPQRELRAMVPVSTRTESQEAELGNHVSCGLVDLPIGPMDQIERLREVTRRTRDFKSSPATFALPSLVDLGRWVPWRAYEAVSRIFSRQRLFNLVVSNIPGPRESLYLNGAKLVAYYPVMPIAETVGLSIAVTSLSGVMGFGIVSDWDAIDDIEALAGTLVGSFTDLRKAAA